MAPARSGPSWASTARGLYLVSMAVFLVTIAIGILNGLDLVEFPRDVLLTHVHSGTLGWITLSIVATAAWLYGGISRWLAILLAVLTPLYIAAFLSGNFTARAVGGVLIFVPIAWLIVWAWRSYLGTPRSLPRLAMVLGLTTFTYGAVIGVILQIQFAANASWLSADAIGSHAGAMVFSYLILVSVGLIEWRVLGTAGLPRAGVVQVAALFVAGLVLSIGLLTGTGQVAGGLYLLLTLVAAVLFIARVMPRALRVGWLAAVPARHVGASAIWVVVAVGLFMYLVFTYISAGGDTSKVSTSTLIASDHSAFIGVITNLLFGLVATLSPARNRPGWLDQLVFWGLNAGLAVFVVGLIAESAEVKRIGSPVMGAAILLGLALLAWQTWISRDTPAPAGNGAVAGA